MSGFICGNVALNSERSSDFDEVFNKQVIDEYKLDKFNYTTSENAQFACGIIQVTKEDEAEVLPFYDCEAELFITADVILDNRKELLEELFIDAQKDVITDGTIVLEAYKKWGYETPKHLLGDFAFAVWDKNQQELFITRDHTGTRSLYYSRDENAIKFSTTLEPLINKKRNEEELLCEEWLINFLSSPDGITDLDAHLTMYRNIFQCPIARSLVINQNGVKMFTFWEPEKMISSKIDKHSKDEWLKMFNRIYDKAVSCRIRSEKNIGIFLSGGLDSTSVAAIAAQQLKKSDKNLYSFTSIPKYEVDGYNEKFLTVNEQEDVETFIKYFTNIKADFVDCSNESILSTADELIKIIEMPFQVIQNLPWINEIYKKAFAARCKVMLKGQFGNVTVSRGEFLVHIQTLKKEHRYLEIIKEVNQGSKLYNISSKVILKQIRAMWTPELIKKLKRKLLHQKKNKYNAYLEFINQDLLKEYDTIEKLKSKGLYERYFQKEDFYQESANIIKIMEMSMVGTYDTKFGLHYGMVTRDPTKDIRIIEFCLKAPYELFVEKGLERKLIRDAMENIVPDEIRLNRKRRGVQGVDWDKRIRQHQAELFRQIAGLKQSKRIFDFLNREKVEKILENKAEISDFKNIEDLKQVIYWLILQNVFIKQNLNW